MGLVSLSDGTAKTGPLIRKRLNAAASSIIPKRFRYLAIAFLIISHISFFVNNV